MYCNGILILVIIILCGFKAADLCHIKCECTAKTLTCHNLTLNDIESTEFHQSITADLEQVYITKGHIPVLNITHFCLGDKLLDSLIKLDIKRNGITEINEPFSDCMPNLEELVLSHNHWNVSTIQANIFQNMTKLKKIDMSRAFVDSTDFINIAHLQAVFSDNSLQSLEVLSLDHNEFSIFDENSANVVCAFPALKRLDLSNNFLPKITLYHETCVPRLEYIDLSWNSIITIDDYSHSGLLYTLDFIQSGSPNLTVSFIGNEFDCDCGLLEFRNWLIRTDVNVASKNELKCHNGNLLNRTIVSVQSEEFTCFSVNDSLPTEHIVIGVLVTLLVLIVLVLSVCVFLYRKKIKRFVKFRVKSPGKNEYMSVDDTVDV